MMLMHRQVHRRLVFAILVQATLSLVSAATVSAQGATTAAEAIAAGDRESNAHRAAQALVQYEIAIQRDSTNAEAFWKAAGKAVDLGEVERDAKARRAFYARAVAHGRKAVEFAPREADAHFHLARAIGRTALDVGPRDRVRFAGEVRSHAMTALELDPRHPGALHVSGVWHAEVMRLNSIARAFARSFLGGRVLGTASWQEAARLLEQAVAVEPRRAVHRLDLARIYRDMGRKADARREYQATIDAPVMDASDGEFKRAAAEELRAMK